MYSFLKPEIKRQSRIEPGSFTFYETPSFSGAVIRRIQERVFTPKLPDHLKWTVSANHSAFVVGEDVDNEPMILDNVVPRCRVRRQDSVKDRGLVAVVTPTYLSGMTYGERGIILEAMTAKAMSQVGAPYSWWEILGLLYWSVKTLSGRVVVRNPIRGGTICTEQDLGLKLDFERFCGVVDGVNAGLDKDTTFPAQLLHAFIESPYYEVQRVIH
jgi:hypothetical protein